MLGDGACIYHVHSKESGNGPHNTRINGTLDFKNHGDGDDRSWVFRTCGTEFSRTERKQDRYVPSNN